MRLARAVLLAALCSAGQAPQQLRLKEAPPVPAKLLTSLPARNTGRHGRPADPFTLLFLGDEAQIRGMMTEAGWTQIPVVIHQALESSMEETLWRGQKLKHFPMHTYWLNGRREDQNWALPSSINYRHHFRLWKLTYADDRGRTLWWGSGDTDLRVRWRDLSHVIDPDASHERDFIMGSISGSRWIEAMWVPVLPQIPAKVSNDFGYTVRSDGRVLVVGLKNP